MRIGKRKGYCGLQASPKSFIRNCWKIRDTNRKIRDTLKDPHAIGQISNIIFIVPIKHKKFPKTSDLKYVSEIYFAIGNGTKFFDQIQVF